MYRIDVIEPTPTALTERMRNCVALESTNRNTMRARMRTRTLAV